MTISPATITVAPAARGVRALGLDLSLRSTGVASSLGWCTRIRPGGPGSPNRHMCGLERLRYIVGKIKALAVDYDLAVIEGAAYARGGQAGHDELSALRWMVRDAVDRAGIPIAMVPPATLKLYATGSGKASKADMVAAACDRYPLADVRTDDEADALHLADMGAAWLLDFCLSPTQQRAMRGVPWPASEVTVR